MFVSKGTSNGLLYQFLSNYPHVVPGRVNDLTLRTTGEELLILWTGLKGDIIHYTVTIYQENGTYFQNLVSQLQLHLIISREVLRYEQSTELYIEVSAANDAGNGQPAVVFYEQPNEPGIEEIT